MRFFCSSKSLLIITALCFSTQFSSAQSSEPAIASLLKVEGAVEAVTAKSPKGRRGINGMLLFSGDKINTAENSKATIEYRDGSRVTLQAYQLPLALEFSAVLILSPANRSIPFMPLRPFGDLAVTASTAPSTFRSVAIAGSLI